ncbi:MAG: branched-chain amino acid ABC transporter permease [Pseudomonadota bacterium]
MRFVFKTSYEADIRLFRHTPQAMWYLALLAFVLILPFLLSDYAIGIASQVLIYSIAGMGLMLLTGHTGLPSLGHAAFMAIGCFANIFLISAGLPWLISFPLAGLLAGAIGVVIAYPVLRLHGVYLAIATLAMSILTADFVVILEPWTGGVGGAIVSDINLFGYEINYFGAPTSFYYVVLAVVLIVLILYRNLLRAPLGRAFTAIRDSEISAQAMGINLTRTKVISFFLSCTFTGLAGALVGHSAGYVNHETFDIVLSITLLLMIIIGGIGSIHGAFFGAMVVGIIPQLIATARSGIGNLTGVDITIPGLESALFGAILIGFMLFEPFGIYGRWLKIRTYFELFPFYRRDMFRRQKNYLKTERMR